MKARKILSAALAMAFITAAASCSAGSAAQTKDSSKLKIVTTIYPEYDWVREIMGEKASDAEVIYLLNNGADLHNYQPSVEDIANISDCDLFIYVGGESDKWASGALKNSTNPDMKIIELMETAGENAKEEEVKEGMEAEEEDEDDEEEDEADGHHSGEAEYDEHVWLSLRLAKIFCGEIADKLCELDPENEQTYRGNLTSYTQKLDTLDAEYKETADALPQKTLIFGDRFPFRYMVEDYELDYYAAFLGCSAETEASFETIVFLADKIDELGIKAVFQIETSDGRLAETIINNARSQNTALLTLNSLQSSKADGKTYLDVMRENLNVLKEYQELQEK